MRGTNSKIVGVLTAAVFLGGCSLFGGTNESGKIQFGQGFQRVSAHAINVVHPQTVFHKGQFIGWVAHLKKPADATSITLTILSSGRHPSTLVTESVPVNPHWNELAHSQPVRWLEALHLRAPGSYVLRYARGHMVLAEGSFRLTG